VCQKYRCRLRQEFVVFTRKVVIFTLSFISKGIHLIATTKFLCKLEIPMLITTYSHNTQTYGSYNRARIIDEGTCSSDDHCVFLSSFNCLGGNNSLYFAKIATGLALLNSPSFQICKNVKMAKNCIKVRYFWKLSFGGYFRVLFFLNW